MENKSEVLRMHQFSIHCSLSVCYHVLYSVSIFCQDYDCLMRWWREYNHDLLCWASMQPSLCWFHTIESKLLSCFHFSSSPLGIILGEWSQLEQEIIWNTSSNNSNCHVLKNSCSFTLHFSKTINDWMDGSYKAFYHSIAKQ